MGCGEFSFPLVAGNICVMEVAFVLGNLHVEETEILFSRTALFFLFVFYVCKVFLWKTNVFMCVFVLWLLV